MNKTVKKVTGLLLAAALTAVGLAGCGGQENTTDNNTGNTPSVENTAGFEDISGTLSLAGSTSMEKLCEAMMEGFMEKYPDVTVTTEYTGSGAGLESLTAGSVDIGNASRKVKDEEKQKGAVENIVALDGIAVITDSENTVTALTSEQLADIYTGKITNWNELGGKDEAIVLIGRESGSGTRDAFEELLDIADKCTYAQELDSTGAVLARVSSTSGAIGYVSLDVVDDSVTSIALNGSEASEENIISGSYALQRPFVMATKGEISKQNELVQAWFDYIGSEEGKEIIESVGLIIPE
ncbi:MAG: phosphate ABC transporter substrate-binding protein [Lachnospiraceae bacterium]|nr:phosphate ABC transporter substrate-binding protein [Lachnospiraceae bacterium]